MEKSTDENLQLPVFFNLLHIQKERVSRSQCNFKNGTTFPADAKQIICFGQKDIYSWWTANAEVSAIHCTGVLLKRSPHTSKMPYRNACQRKKVAKSSYTKYCSFIPN